MVELQDALNQNQLTWLESDRIENGQVRPIENRRRDFQGNLLHLIDSACSTSAKLRLHVHHDPGKPILTGEKHVVYWQRNTMRTDETNLGLLNACFLAKALDTAVIVIILLPHSILLPVECAKTATEAYSRASYAEFVNNLQSLGIAAYGITTKSIRSKSTEHPGHDTIGGFELLNVLAMFNPCMIITDDAFNIGSIFEVEALCHLMRENSDKLACPLLAADSQSFVSPRILDRVTRGQEATSSAVDGAICSDKAQFSRIHTELFTESLSKNGQIEKDGLNSIIKTLTPSRQSQCQLLELEQGLDKFDLELVDWFIVKGLSSKDPFKRLYTASEGINALDSIVSHLSSGPTIQEELRGGGIMSLQPFIRHGTLSSIYVMQRVLSMINLAKARDDRKQFAALKVLQSRAMEYLVRDRDHALYLSMQLSSRLVSRPQQYDSQLESTQLFNFTTTTHSLDPSQSYL